MKEQEKVLSIDIGESKIVVGIVDRTGRVLKNEKIQLPTRYDEHYLCHDS